MSVVPGNVARPNPATPSTTKRRSGMNRGVIAVLAAILMVFAVFAANQWLQGSLSFAPTESDPEKVDKYSHYLEILLTSVDQLVAMLVTVHLSLFVLGGFAVNKRLGETHRASATLL